MDMDETHTERWLGYELHDGLLQWIIGARLQLLATLSREQELDAAAAASVRKALTSLEIALEEGRELIGYLEHDQELAGVKFVARLESFIQATQSETQQHQQQIALHLDAETRDALQDSLSNTASWNVLRIVQQAVRNAIQHAGPTRIDVYAQVLSDAIPLATDVRAAVPSSTTTSSTTTSSTATSSLRQSDSDADDRVLLMTVADQGRGFDLRRPTSDSNHFGLNSMDHRARLVGARLTIDSRPGAGCRVECRLPLN